MTQIITTSELEHLTETELRSKLYDIQKELSRSPLSTEESYQVMTSLETVRQAIQRRKTQGPKL